MPIIGLIFPRNATKRLYEAEAAKAAGKILDRPVVEADLTRRRVLNLLKSARFDVIFRAPEDGKPRYGAQ